MNKKQRLLEIYNALNTIKVSGAEDCTTLSNCFKALAQIINEEGGNDAEQQSTTG